MSKNQKAQLGDLVTITDKKSLFYATAGVVSSELDAANFLVTILDQGNDRTVVVSKKGLEVNPIV